MATFLRRKVDTTLEKRIITGLIVSKQFLNEIYPLVDFEYFTNSFTQTIAVWACEFYETYEAAPFDHIQDIFEIEKEKLPEEESILIEELLVSISKKYSLDKGVNVEYLRDQAIEYFNFRELQIRTTNTQNLLLKGDIKGAKEEQKKLKNVQQATSGWVNPFAENEVKKYFEEAAIDFFMFPGELGKYMGPIDKGWLIGIEGAFKRGKTWMLIEFAVMAVLSKIPTVIFSLEMSLKQMKERIYKRLTAYAMNIEEFGYIKYPVFDCKDNQHGDCDRAERRNKITLMAYNEEIPKFNLDMDYSPCTWCRTNSSKDYKVASWFQAVKRPEFNQTTVPKSMKEFDEFYGHLFRIIAYPRYTKNVADMDNELDMLEQTEEITPQMIIVDYAEICGPETINATGIQKEDETWMALASLAGKRYAAVITGTQVKIEGLEVRKLKLKHTARWIGKLGHVDCFYAINQDSFEKRAGMLRVSAMAHRHMEIDEYLSCCVLQQLDVGQPVLDSQIVVEEYESKK